MRKGEYNFRRQNPLQGEKIKRLLIYCPLTAWSSVTPRKDHLPGQTNRNMEHIIGKPWTGFYMDILGPWALSHLYEEDSARKSTDLTTGKQIHWKSIPYNQYQVWSTTTTTKRFTISLGALHKIFFSK